MLDPVAPRSRPQRSSLSPRPPAPPTRASARSAPNPRPRSRSRPPRRLPRRATDHRPETTEPETTEPPHCPGDRARDHPGADRAAGAVAPARSASRNCSPTSRSATSSTSTPTSRCATTTHSSPSPWPTSSAGGARRSPQVYGEQFEPLSGGVWAGYPERQTDLPGCGEDQHPLRGSQPVRRVLLRVRRLPDVRRRRPEPAGTARLGVRAGRDGHRARPRVRPRDPEQGRRARPVPARRSTPSSRPTASPARGQGRRTAASHRCCGSATPTCAPG